MDSACGPIGAGADRAELMMKAGVVPNAAGPGELAAKACIAEFGKLRLGGKNWGRASVRRGP